MFLSSRYIFSKCVYFFYRFTQCLSASSHSRVSLDLVSTTWPDVAFSFLWWFSTGLVPLFELCSTFCADYKNDFHLHCNRTCETIKKKQSTNLLLKISAEQQSVCWWYVLKKKTSIKAASGCIATLSSSLDQYKGRTWCGPPKGPWFCGDVI